MTKYVKFFYLLSIALLIACQPKEMVFKDAICIQNINTIDPTDGLKEHQTVIIKNGKLLKIDDTAAIPLSQENNTIIDGTDKFLIPGLWDAHVHFAYIEELAPSMFDLFLTHGITSVRDTGGKVDFVKFWKDQALSNPTKAPRVRMAGPLLDGTPNVYDGSDAQHPELSVGLNSVHAVEQQIELLATKNVDLLKAYEMLSQEQFLAIISMAKAKGLKVTGHVPLSMDVITASNSGLNSMEHLRNLELSCASNSKELWSERKEMLANGTDISGGSLRSAIHDAQREIAITNYDETKAQEVLAVLKKNDTWQIPTLALNTFFTARYFGRKDHQESYKLVPDSIGQYWKQRSEALTKIEASDFRKTYDAWNYKMVGKIHEAGIDIMAGTDTPIAFLTPGFSLHEELTVLVKAGLSPLEALKTATLNPAKYFNLEKELGSIKEAMWADLIILDANPLDDIKNTRKINTVIKQGEVYTRKKLDDMLYELEHKETAPSMMNL